MAVIQIQACIKGVLPDEHMLLIARDMLISRVVAMQGTWILKVWIFAVSSLVSSKVLRIKLCQACIQNYNTMTLPNIIPSQNRSIPIINAILKFLHSLNMTNVFQYLQYFNQIMFKLRSEKWKKQIRVAQRQQIKKMQRDRISLLEKLNEQLQIYVKCSLVSGDSQALDHHNFFDCESFVYEMNNELFRLIVAIGIQNCKAQLLQNRLPSILFRLTQTIQNKTVEQNQIQQVKHFYSRERVLESIADILCLLTQDQQLVNQYGQYIISMLATVFKSVGGNAGQQQKWNNKIIGLQNLFEYDCYEHQTYRELQASNIELNFQRYCVSIIDNRVLPIDISINLFALLRKYLCYRQKYTQEINSKSIIRTFSQMVTHIFSPQSAAYLDSYSSEFIDQFLKISQHFHLAPDVSLTILKRTELYPYLSFIQLLNTCTYCNPQISLRDFNCQEIKQMLLQTQLKDHYSEKYTEVLAACLVNLLCNTEDSEEVTQMVWKCMEETNSIEQFDCEGSTIAAFRELKNLLNIYPPSDI